MRKSKEDPLKLLEAMSKLAADELERPLAPTYDEHPSLTGLVGRRGFTKTEKVMLGLYARYVKSLHASPENLSKQLGVAINETVVVTRSDSVLLRIPYLQDLCRRPTHPMCRAAKNELAKLDGYTVSMAAILLRQGEELIEFNSSWHRDTEHFLAMKTAMA